MVVSLDAWAANSAEPVGLTPMVLNLKLNGVELGSVLTLRAPDEAFYLSEGNLDQWQVCRDSQRRAQYQGQLFFPIGTDARSQVTYDAVEQTLDIVLPAKCFSPTNISLRRHASALTPSAPGLFFNYDFYASGAHEAGGNQHNLSGLFESVGSNRVGSLSVDVLAPNIGGGAAASLSGSPDTLIRLDTTFTHDDALDMTRWELGDAIGGSGIWGRPVRFAGVRFSRNFDTHPGFVTQPLPSITGETQLPSTVEVYLNGVLATRQQVQPGPFQINDLPTFGSGGNMQLVVRDLLGREVITDLPFVTGGSLLKKGLSDFSVETGVLRDNYGIHSFDYSNGFFTATGRYGVTDELTVEGRSETREGIYTGGLGSSYVLPLVEYVLTAAGAASHGSERTGHQETLSLQPGAAQRIGLTASVQINSDRFVQLGSALGQLPPRYVGTASLSVPLGRQLVITLSQVRNAPRGEPNNVIDSLALRDRLGRMGSISLSAFTSGAGPRNQGLLLAFSLSLGGNNSWVSTANVQRDQTGTLSTQLQSEYDYLPTSELGWGWDMRLAHDESASGNTGGAGFVYQGHYLSASGQLDANSGSAQYQLDVSGGGGVLAGRWFASRKIFDSFGVARVGDMPNVPIYVENQLAGYTDAQGRALLPRLIAFSDNKISIDANDLPFDATLDGSDSISVAPYYRSGVVVDLPVRRFKSALVALVQADGTPVPAGARVVYPTTAADLYVANRGEIYLRDVAALGNQLQVEWAGHRCQAHFDLPQGARVQPRIGPVPCVEDNR
jgi:outer membrane usher protein